MLTKQPLNDFKKQYKITLLQHICMYNDRHSQQMDNDLQALHSKKLKEQLLFQLLERKWWEPVQNAL